jgi:hypothetical protein
MKALWLNPVATGSTSLDSTVNPHDVEQIAHAHILSKQGFSNYLHEPFIHSVKHSSFRPRILSHELRDFSADIAILSISPFINDYCKFRYWEERERGTARSKTLDAVCNFLDKHEGNVFIFMNDPRLDFQKIFLGERKKLHPLHPHIDRAKLIVADTLFLHESLKPRAILSEYWKHVSVGPILDFDNRQDFFCVYPGLKSQKKPRVQQVKDWFGAYPNCYTVGEIAVEGVPSLSNYSKVPLSTVLDLTARSTTSLITGEPKHTWLTPRVIQSLCQGTICSIHPDFPGKHWFPEEILRDQVFSKADDFDRSLLTEKIYNRQVEFALSLKQP